MPVTLIKGMVIRCQFGEARVIAVGDVVRLGFGGGQFKRIPTPELRVDHIVSVPSLATPRTFEPALFTKVCKVMRDGFVLDGSTLAWMLSACGTPEGLQGLTVSAIGSGPISHVLLEDTLATMDRQFSPLSTDTDVLVVGRTNWTQSDLKRALDFRAGETLRVYSQEMFVAWIAT